MPIRFEHNSGAESLEYLPNYLFGSNDVPKDLINSVNKWMDYPVTPVHQGGMLGWTIQEGSLKGQVITPNTHRGLHHDPFDITKVYSGDGGHDPDSFATAVIHNQMDKNTIDKWLLSNGLPGSAQFAAAGLFNSIGKGLFSAFENVPKIRNGIIPIDEGIKAIAKDAGIGFGEGIARLSIGSAVHQGVLLTGSEILKNISSNGGALAAGFTIYELGSDLFKFYNGKITGSQVTENAFRNAAKSTVGLYSAKIGAMLGIVGGPFGVAAGALIGGIVGGVITDQIILTVIQDLKMKPEDFIKPLNDKDMHLLSGMRYYFIQIPEFRNFIYNYVGDFESLIRLERKIDIELSKFPNKFDSSKLD